VSASYTETQLDALRELANIASGTAATSLSQMLGHQVDMNVPMATAVPLAGAVELIGDPADVVTAIILTVTGDITAVVVLLVHPTGVKTLSTLLGVESGTEVGDSALGEIGNIIGASYLNAISTMTGLALAPSTPTLISDLLGAIVESTLAATVAEEENVLIVDSQLQLPGESCEITFMLLPQQNGASNLLAPLGLAIGEV
jgi:chemotaxis protein CheC